MASIYKTLQKDDIATTLTLLHEAVPITGSILSGTYDDNNIKNYTHGRFQSVYDYPYLSASSNHIMDMSVGYAPDTAYTVASDAYYTEKTSMYNQMAQVLMGYDVTGSIQNFDADGDIVAGGTKITEAYFLNFARLLKKDEIKKGSFEIQIGTGSFADPMGAADLITLADTNAATSYKVNSPAGEYGILLNTADSSQRGLIFYQAGIAVLNLSGSLAGLDGDGVDTMETLFTGSHITSSCDALRNRISNISFNNTTKLSSQIIFCRVNGPLYSTNKTYTSASRIVTKNQAIDESVAYLTGVQLHGSDGAVLAIAKLSEPLKISGQASAAILRIRNDF